MTRKSVEGGGRFALVGLKRKCFPGLQRSELFDQVAAWKILCPRWPQGRSKSRRTGLLPRHCSKRACVGSRCPLAVRRPAAAYRPRENVSRLDSLEREWFQRFGVHYTGRCCGPDSPVRLLLRYGKNPRPRAAPPARESAVTTAA